MQGSTICGGRVVIYIQCMYACMYGVTESRDVLDDEFEALSRDESLRNLQSITPTGNPALQMTIQGDRVLVQLKNLSASQLATWLAQARSNAQALPDEVHISRSTSSSVSASTGLSASSGVNASSNPTNATTAWDGQIILRLPQRSANNANASVNSNVSGARP